MGTRYKRPDGTDGTDHQFREQIDDSYKSMPIWRTAGWLALHAAFIPMCGKMAIAFVPHYLDGGMPHPQTMVMAAMYLLAVIFWKLAKPATYKESLLLTKLTNTCVMILCVLHVVELYRYHTMLPKHTLYPRRLAQYLREEVGGTWAAGHWQNTFTVFEALVECFTMVFLGAAAFSFHNYILRKMQLEKKIAADKKKPGGKDGGDGEGEDAGASKVKTPSGAGPRSRRPGRA
uniref:Uncharacterized protein n=1 Tax=Chlamydomonas leiostraca TaxID=1034604 RepID=A0A7S0RK51_9CHLO|eukprot:CAMPEP_0202860084 /NCGR_PEP_ID=MMETSP1391-20130828/1943_1 /ASSEMBLY_ACC=CAM_ASM_000867 /TAXON_ID=1034604 /ORGANISM="Chlamydomonas leiostraca, Strain SAG 11-49" /LENGTH=231 /DNA_ID=CAMNT_0049539219 /DNA_START=63 /DNA_END=758 /DNA_ORIENTATION=+